MRWSGFENKTGFSPKIDSELNISPYMLEYRRRYRKPVTSRSKLETFKRSLKTISKEYCSESSICGLKHLVNENTSCFERFLWVTILISALICSISLVWITFVKYYQAPLVTTQMPEGVSVTEIIFPAIGICSNNRISKTAVTELADKLLKEERNKKYSQEEMLQLLFGLGHLYNLHGTGEESTMELQVALGIYDVKILLRDLTPRCEKMLLKCAWNKTPMNCTDLFDFRLTMNGFCCTFNYLRQVDIFEQKRHSRSLDMYKYGNRSSFDYDQGLKVLLRLDESDDFYYNIPLRGAQFSDAYDFPDAPSGSYAMQLINPDVQMSVMITPCFTEASRDIQHVPIQLRNCLFYDESSYLPFYTHSDCMLKCRMLFLLSNCNCTPFNIPKMTQVRTCDISDVPCLRRYYAQSVTNRPKVNDQNSLPPELELELARGGIFCPMCYPTCSKTTYSYDFNNVNIYTDLLNNVPDHSRDDWLQGGNFTGTSIVHVKYAREVADRYGQNVIMKWFDLISNIGSTCGFVTGFSFVSVLEFVYFFTVKLLRDMDIRRHRDRKQGTNMLRAESTGDSQHISRYRPIYWNELGAGHFGINKPFG